ncbi:hypothetical protein DSO57_1020407 [Entomophthora muscae]|uniref:Uncharacterized protein n=1 Tax=Entomophthora muscae TaxID=34485 RepID=A0ACC2S5V0_9FUNG|nr:hypothetical protein DSO57_1020407 [Entomophthora muscae]
MLQHVVPAKASVITSEELPLVPIDCDNPVLPAAVQEMIERYFQEHPASLATVRTANEKQEPAKIATFAANKSTSGYFLFYDSIDNDQTIYQCQGTNPDGWLASVWELAGCRLGEQSPPKD